LLWAGVTRTITTDRGVKLAASVAGGFGSIVLQKSAVADLGVSLFLESRAPKALALTHFTQLRRYATRRA
jgi:hypothetical protein